MKKTKKKILQNAIELFNQKGISNVRLEDIAKRAGISKGNLHYHYPTKKEILEAVLVYLPEERTLVTNNSEALLSNLDLIGVIKNYLHFQFAHRFFYRDIFEIAKIVPKAKSIYEDQLERSDNFTKTFIYLSVGRGYMVPELHEGHYDFFAKFASAVIQSWLEKRELLGAKKYPLADVVATILELNYPYLTEKGIKWHEQMLGRLPELQEAEILTNWQGAD